MPKRMLTALGTRYRGSRSQTATIPYSSGNTGKVEIQDDELLRSLVIRLQGNLIIGTSAATIFDEAPLSLIRSITIACDGTKKTLQAGSGYIMQAASHFTRHQQPELSAPVSTVGTRAFSAVIVLDSEFFDMVDPSESLFDSRRFRKVEVVVNWGLVTDIATAGGGGTIQIDTPNTFVTVMAKRVGVGAGQILFDRVMSQDASIVPGTNAKWDQFKLPQGGLIKGIVLRTTRDAGAGAGPQLVDDVINDISVISNNTTQHDQAIQWSQLQRDNQASLELGPSLKKGYVYLDFSENGSFASLINVAAIAETKLRLNVTQISGTQLVEVGYIFAEPRPQAVAA